MAAIAEFMLTVLHTQWRAVFVVHQYVICWLPVPFAVRTPAFCHGACLDPPAAACS